MDIRHIIDDERGVSEVYGAFLIISIVVVMGVLIVGLGFLAFNDSTDNVDDDLVKQSMQEFDSRVNELSEADVSETVTMEFPEGAADKIDAQPDHGTVNISIKTGDMYWDITNPNGTLLDNASSQQNTTEITLGSLVYENKDGQMTAFQGGAVWQKEGDSVTMVSPPDLHVSDGTVDFSFVNISAIDLVQEGQEVALKKDPKASAVRSESVMQIVEQQLLSHYPDGRNVANATISMNITSKFAEGWKQYADSNLEVAGTELHDASEVAGDLDKVEITIGTYGDGLANVDGNRTYDTNVTYSGYTEFAQDLYDNGTAHTSSSWNANITNSTAKTFNVTKPGWNTNEYTVGVLHNNESRGNGPEWWAWNGSHWRNVEDPHAAPLDLPDFSAVNRAPTGSGNEFEFNSSETWSCVAATADKHDPDDFREFIPNETEYKSTSVSNGCLAGPAGINITKNDGWKDYVGDFKTDFNITGFDVTVKDKNGNKLSTFDPKNDYLQPGYTLNMTVEGKNEGYRNATSNEIPLGVLYGQNSTSKAKIAEDPRIINGTRLGTNMGETFSRSYTFDVNDANDQYFLGVGAGTPHDAAGFADNYTVEVVTKSNFNVTITDNKVGGSNTIEGDSVSVGLNVTNVGPIKDNQTVFIWGEKENQKVLTTSEFSLNPGQSNTTSLTWKTEVGREASWTKITASAPLSKDSVNNDTVPLDVQKPPNGPKFDVTILGTNATAPTRSVTEGEQLTVDIKVKNTGDAPGKPTAVLYNSTAGADKPVDGVEAPKIADGNTWSTTLTWYTFVNDSSGDTHVKVEVGSDTAQKNVTIEPREPTRKPADVVFAIDETGSMGEPGGYQDDVVFYNPPTPVKKVVPDDEMWKVEVYEKPCNGNGNCPYNKVNTDKFFVTGQVVNLTEYNVADSSRAVQVIKYGYPDDWDDQDKDIERIPAMWTAIEAMNTSLDRGAALQFDTEQSFHHSLTSDLTALNESLRVDPEGGTNIGGGLGAAMTELVDETALDVGNPDQDRAQVVILLTDGQHNDGTNPVSVAEETNVTNGDDPLDLSVYTVGFGNANEGQLKQVSNIAGNGQGNFTWADNPEDIAGIFEGLIKDVTSERPKIKITDMTPLGGSTIKEGDSLTVEVEVKNVGSGTGKVPIMLREQLTTTGIGIPVNATSVDIAPGSTETFNLSWDTTGAVDPGNNVTDGIVVESPQNEDGTTITVENPLASFVVNDVVTNADDGTNSITSGEDLVVDVNVTNAGSKTEKQDLIFKRNDTNIGSPLPITTNKTKTFIPGETSWVNGTVISSAEIVANTTKLVVETEDGSVEKQAVNITTNTATNVTVSIDPNNIPPTDSSQAVDAGKTVTVPVNITNTASTSITDNLVVSLYKQLDVAGSPESLANITTVTQNIGAGNSIFVDVEWDTTGNGWEDDPWVLTAEVETEADTVDVWVNEADGPPLSGPQFGNGGSGISFGIEDIEVAD
ncbi:VWA domain-containing protein [Halovenus rubra]|uniref:VWA domain-containing protein n=2 Tax=Halovenus rubra TaxID=869890 RepID=A0ACC7E1S0_9EURY|nr:VWA domain-containing protein [Halovenus rubra]